MRAGLAAAGVLLALSACATDLPLLHPNQTAAQILALPAKAGISSARYRSTFAGPDGTAYQALSGTVQLKPERALSRLVPAGGKGGASAIEYREVGGVAYGQALPGWSHPRWTAYPSAAGQGAPADPTYFDSWSGLGQMQVEGQEGSAVDRAWRLVAHPPMFGGNVAVRIWVRERDGYPLKYQADSPKGRQAIVFDRFNGNPKITAPPAADLLPPPATVADAGSYRWAGGSVRVLAVDRRYVGSLVGAPAVGSHNVGVEVYADTPNRPVVPDFSRWELLPAAGAPYPTTGNPAGAAFGKGGGGDQLAFFSVPDWDGGPFSLHIVLVEYSKPELPSNAAQPPVVTVVLDTVIRLS